jgi:hypothetical protein
MAKNDALKNPKKLRKAKIFMPPHPIKEKAGAGGLDPAVIVKAERIIQDNTTDFRPIAEELLEKLEGAANRARNNPAQGGTIEAMLAPAAQFKAQGAVFHFPLVSDLSDILINFLETVKTPVPADALDIVDAHRMAISVVIGSNMTDRFHPHGGELKRQLTEACGRYYKKAKD